eukprot:11158639-Lingulodinium_polyedra.AAC.1
MAPLQHQNANEAVAATRTNAEHGKQCDLVHSNGDPCAEHYRQRVHFSQQSSPRPARARCARLRPPARPDGGPEGGGPCGVVANTFAAPA